MASQITSFPMTLSDLQDHSPIASLFRYNKKENKIVL